MQKIIQHNRKANFNYETLKVYTAGVSLLGNEVKSIRGNNCNITDGYCMFDDMGNLDVIGFHIAPYKFSTGFNEPDPYRHKRLLLNKSELASLSKSVKEKGLAIIPKTLYINDKGKVKLDIALCRGKHEYDKRESIKQRDIDRENKNIY